MIINFIVMVVIITIFFVMLLTITIFLMVLIIINFIVRMINTITKMMFNIAIITTTTVIIIIIITMIIQIKIAGHCAVSSLEREDLPLSRSNPLVTYQHHFSDSC